MLTIDDPYICGGKIYGTVTTKNKIQTITVTLSKDGVVKYTFHPSFTREGYYEVPFDYNDVNAKNYVIPSDYTVNHSVIDTLGNTRIGTKYVANITNACGVTKKILEQHSIAKILKKMAEPFHQAAVELKLPPILQKT